MATIEHRSLNTIGPLKFEVINLSDFDTGDEVESSMQNPEWATLIVTEDGVTHINPVTTSISGKTITFTSASISGDSAVALVFGF